MLDQIKEWILRWQLQKEQWDFHLHQAKLLTEQDLRYYAAGHGFNPQFAKACKHELESRH